MHLRKKASGKGVMSPGLLGWGMAKPCTKDSKDKGAKEPPQSGGQGPGPCCCCRRVPEVGTQGSEVTRNTVTLGDTGTAGTVLARGLWAGDLVAPPRLPRPRGTCRYPPWRGQELPARLLGAAGARSHTEPCGWGRCRGEPGHKHPESAGTHEGLKRSPRGCCWARTAWGHATTTPGPCRSRDKQHQCVAPTRRAGGAGAGLGPRAREAPVLLIRPLRKLHEIPAATRPSYGSR